MSSSPRLTLDLLLAQGEAYARDFIASLTDEEAELLKFTWEFWARPHQLAPQDPDWVTWLILAGRGFGKTRSGAEWVRALVESGKYSRIAIVAEDAGDARDVMIEGESGIMNVCPPWNKPNYQPSNKRLTWPNGATAHVYSSDDPESLRGPQHDAAWLDELCKWRYAQETWDQLQFGLRLGLQPRQLVTTTPRNIKLLKQIIATQSTRTVTGSTYENLRHLAPQFRELIVARYEGTRLGRQELQAHILDDNPQALFHASIIDQHRVRERPDCRRVLIGVDPPVTGNENSDECGIVAAGKLNRDFFVMGDRTVQGRSPEGWAKQVVEAYYSFEADAVVAEVNNGGDMVESVIKNADSSIKVIKVRASRGKWTRAEPIAGLYEQGRVHHVGQFATLEDQMCDFDPTGLADKQSPDRMDAMVWAITELSGKSISAPRVRKV